MRVGESGRRGRRCRSPARGTGPAGSEIAIRLCCAAGGQRGLSSLHSKRDLASVEANLNLAVPLVAKRRGAAMILVFGGAVSVAPRDVRSCGCGAPGGVGGGGGAGGDGGGGALSLLPACGRSAGESGALECEWIHIGPMSKCHKWPVTSSLAWTHSRDAMREGSTCQHARHGRPEERSALRKQAR
jgi:hypothetical protein